MMRANRQALLAKLIEEAQEASHATADDLPGELADVLEVLRALTVTAGMSWPQLLALAEDKRRRRGGFGQRIFLESVRHQHSCTASGAAGPALMPMTACPPMQHIEREANAEIATDSQPACRCPVSWAGSLSVALDKRA
jgi:predicted house-cleaning noncanonical NTP pyrophosphatase (MazG superfamily)